MNYQVRLDTFEGPLDLLLFLIRKNEMDIANIEIAKITQQYLDFINTMKVLNVDLASEFIVMAATLIYIKSKMLLPAPPEEIEDEEGDPREALMRRLIEYQKYKIGADALVQRPKLNEDFFKVQLVEELPRDPFDPQDGLVEVGIYELALQFQAALTRAKRTVHYVESDIVSVEEKIKEIVSQLQKDMSKSIEFSQLLKDNKTTADIIGTFLAILELTRLHCLKVFQAAHGSEIHLKAKEAIVDFDLNKVHELRGFEYGA